MIVQLHVQDLVPSFMYLSAAAAKLVATVIHVDLENRERQPLGQARTVAVAQTQTRDERANFGIQKKQSK